MPKQTINRFECGRCHRVWESITADVRRERCARCHRQGLASIVKPRKKRKDAKKVGKTYGANALNIHTRPVRNIRRPVYLAPIMPVVEDTDDEEESQVTLPITTRFIAWTAVGASAGGARNTNAQFGGTRAHDHGMQHVPTYAGQPSTSGNAFEWCHFMADSLGGATTQANLFCGTYHANTAMLCIETVLRGKTGFEVQVLVDAKQGTYVAERILYRIRKRQGLFGPVGPVAMFEFIIDGLATGCTKADGEALGGLARAWIRAHA